MARYDYGYRGAWEGPRPTSPFLEPQRGDRRRRGPRPARVTARYNLDYVHESGPEYPVNPNRFGGSWPGQMLGEDEYRWRYLTRGGTNTSRGAARLPPYRYRRFGPRYDGDYFDV